MSVQLRPDEALEALQAVDPESAARWEAILCAATTAIGAELARHYGCVSGEATMEGVGFGGICVPMNPARSDQPLPEGWDAFDDGAPSEWEYACALLAQEEQEGKPMLDFGDYTGDAMVRGDLLPERLQQDALRAYLHRYTREHRPLWATKPRPCGNPYPVQFASDSEWLARTLFPVTIRKGGKLGDHTRAGHGQCWGYPTWPDGLSEWDRAQLARPGTEAATVPEWREGHI